MNPTMYCYQKDIESGHFQIEDIKIFSRNTGVDVVIMPDKKIISQGEERMAS